MKLNFLIFFVALVSTFSTSYGQTPSNTSDDGAIKMLKGFYTAYITENLKDEPDQKKITSIEKKYCTGRLLNKINKMQQNEELDADPFVNAQDFDSNWLRTLSVSKDPKKQNGYMVSYLSEYDKRKAIIKLSVVKEGQNYKIDDIPGL